MTGADVSIRPFYAGWGEYNEQIISVVDPMTSAQLQIRPSPERWPIWATVAHMAGARVYWLCGVLGEPGGTTASFIDLSTGMGWEDDPSTPRDADELRGALRTSWKIVDGCLERWTPAMLEESFERTGSVQAHTRQSVLMRLISHDAYHCGELSQTLGIEGLPQIDLWPPAAR